MQTLHWANCAQTVSKIVRDQARARIVQTQAQARSPSGTIPPRFETILRRACCGRRIHRKYADSFDLEVSSGATLNRTVLGYQVAGLGPLKLLKTVLLKIIYINK